ncbi:ABC transporter permease [Jiangella alba]|uniref:ABC-2 family transporter protein n=1 Tax=Jiangella alba TaxID=561176 RepID=A0A1H5PNP3_9ACTN|nr:ABC transporter permease [Jiangella alba]SEF15440.1 ABC-2 family transporter protein [Jiangella alba]
MSSALRFEWVRLRTLRSTYWLSGIGVLITAGVAFIIAYATRNDPLDDDITAQVLTGGAEFATFIPVFMSIIGVFSTGHEYRHGTIQPTLTAIPQRSRLLLAKIIMVSIWSAVVVAVSLAVNLGLGLIFWGEMPSFGSPIDQVIPGYFVLVILYAICGLALAQLFRGVPSAIVVLLVTPLLVEGLISGLSLVPALDWLQPALKFLPFSAGARLLATSPYEANGGPDFDYLSRWESGGVFAAFVAIILAVAWYLFKKRDA